MTGPSTAPIDGLVSVKGPFAHIRRLFIGSNAMLELIGPVQVWIGLTARPKELSFGLVRPTASLICPLLEKTRFGLEVPSFCVNGSYVALGEPTAGLKWLSIWLAFFIWLGTRAFHFSPNLTFSRFSELILCHGIWITKQCYFAPIKAAF